MLNPAETVQRFNEIIAHPKRGWLAADREGRLKEAPVTTIIKGLVRHTIFFLAKIHLLPTVVRGKTFFEAKVEGPVWGVLSLEKKGFHTGEDLKLTKFIVDNLKPGQVFIDAGANYGWYSVLAAALGAKVYAFEPTRKVYKSLAKNAEGKNITPYQKAVWSSNGEMSFNDFGDEHSVSNTLVSDPKRNNSVNEWRSSTSAYTVPTVSLDDIPKADFIKLDCEGVEYEILSATKKALEHKPILAVELLDVTRKNGIAQKIIDLLAQKGYRGYYITSDFKLEPIEQKPEAPMVNAIFLSNKN